MKRFIAALALWVLLTSAAASETVKIAIAATSDLQSVILPYEMTKDGQKFTVGGFERISAFKSNLESDTCFHGVLLVSSGDDFINPLFSMFNGEPEVTGMNMSRYDVYCPGNHEFDNGAEVFAEAMRKADFDLICANMTFSDTSLQSRIKPYTIKEIGGIKIGFFGLMTPDFFKLTNPGDSQVFMPFDLLDAAEKAVCELEIAGCCCIIGLTHTGFTYDSILAMNVEGIDAVIGGHDHTEYCVEVNGVVLVQNGARAQTIGTLVLSFEDSNLFSIDFRSQLLDSTAGSDEEVREIMLEFQEKYKSGLSTPLGVSMVPFDATRAVVRGRESNIGNLICDSWLRWFQDADVAFLNGGSIRGDMIYPAGEITYGTVLEILPFRNELIKVAMTGAEIKQTLEVSASGQLGAQFDCPDSMRASYGGFLQVGGVRFEIDTLKPSFCAVYSGREVLRVLEPGARIDSVEIFQEGKWNPLEPEKIYTVIVSDWLAGGGDGHFVFLGDSIEKQPTSVYAPDPFLDFFIKNRSVEALTDGRIRIK
ncbi:bifunctional metallophosphatase/5'-nucleotidase [candidate division WOR-3 bacterium]|nr:bifunctional metallophosphatase/5'-nucleotidase [candidate division WOR-3 bacterium]